MSISSIGPAHLSKQPGEGPKAGTEAKIQSLEQRLQTLNTEKEKAVRRKDEKEKKKIEKEILEVKEQIRRLKQQKGKTEAAPDNPELRQPAPDPSGAGQYTDVYA